MYIPAAFAETDLDTLGAFIDTHPLATLALVAEGRVELDHLPVMRSTPLAIGGTLIAHVAQGNATWRRIGEGIDAVLAFSGASAYVSPSLYPSKPLTHQVVPTWNYAAVHLRGRLYCVHDLQQNTEIVDTLTRKMESTQTQPWSLSDAPADYLEKMLRGIVGLRFTVESIEAKFKASQNRSIEDRRGVVSGLSHSPLTSEAASLAAKALGSSALEIRFDDAFASDR